MGERSDGLLHRRLDMLEDRGRVALVAAARRDALAGAFPVAAAVAIPVSALLLLLAFVIPLAVVPAVAIAVLVPIIVFAAIAMARVARLRADRGAALAVIDGAAGMKDRAATTAEFLDAPRDAFRAAALAEAAPWLDRAVTAGIPSSERSRVNLRRPLAMLAVALSLLVAALVVRPVAPEAAAGRGATALRRIAVTAGLSRDASTDPARRSDRAASGPNAVLRDAATAGPGAVSGMADAHPAGSLAGGVADRAAATGGSDAVSRPSAGDAGSASASPGGRGAAGGGGASGAMATGDVPQGRGEGTERASDEAAGQGRGMATGAPESRFTPATGGQGGAGSAMAGTPPTAPRGTSGQEAQQGSGSRSRQSSGSQANGSGSQSNNNKGNQQGSTRGNGTEGAKRARGSTTLMLAVPMQDRLIGTVNAGAVSSTTRAAPPRTMAAGLVTAQDRGAGRGQAGRIRHGGRSAQEDRVLETYFRRAGVDR